MLLARCGSFILKAPVIPPSPDADAPSGAYTLTASLPEELDHKLEATKLAVVALDTDWDPILPESITSCQVPDPLYCLNLPSAQKLPAAFA